MRREREKERRVFFPALEVRDFLFLAHFLFPPFPTSPTDPHPKSTIQVRRPLPLHGRARGPDQRLAVPRGQLRHRQSLDDVSRAAPALGRLLRDERRQGRVEVAGGSCGGGEEEGRRRGGGGELFVRGLGGSFGGRWTERKFFFLLSSRRGRQNLHTFVFPLDLFSPLETVSEQKKQFSEVICATVDNDFKVVRIPAEVRPALERGAARFAAGSEK